MSKLKKVILIVSLILIADQCLKFWVKTTMAIGDQIDVMGNIFYIHFIENPGMALGLTLGSGDWAKMMLTLIRILVVAGLGLFIYLISKNKPFEPFAKSEGKLQKYVFKLSTEKYTAIYIYSMTLIFAGAIGNIIDSVFYGVIFDHSIGQVAQFMPETGGYASLLHGKVVDMLFFPVVDATMPGWSPLWPNENIVFFRPIFNIADSAITVGVFVLLYVLFFKKTHIVDTTSEITNKEEVLQTQEVA